MGILDYFVDKAMRKTEQNDSIRLAGKPLPDGVAVVSDIPYCDDGVRGHLLDIYLPENTGGKLPVLIDIHGGGFMSSYKELDRLFGCHMAKRGFLVFNLNYRLAHSDTTVLGQIQDIALATKWIADHLKAYNGDDSRVFLSGHSSGCVLAVMEALIAESPRMQALFNTQSGGFLQYHGLVLDCGLMNFYKKSLPYWGMRSMCFEKNYQQTAYYQNMIWHQIPEFSSLPKMHLISNEKDELRDMTFDFMKLLDERRMTYQLNYQTKGALGHTAILYNPTDKMCAGVLDGITSFLLENPDSTIQPLT